MREISDLKMQNLQNHYSPLLKWFLEAIGGLMMKYKRNNGYVTVEAFMKVLFVQHKLIFINYFTKIRKDIIKI